MDLNEDTPVSNQVQAYSDTAITVNGTEYTTSLWIDQNNIKPLPNFSLKDITVAFVKDRLSADTECVIIGCGSTAESHPIALIAAISQLRIGCEVMTTPAACRTFNIMSADLRKVVAILLLP